MEPLNRAERSDAFLNFLLLFLVTISLIVVVIFFSINVPFKENQQLRNRVLTLQKEKEFTDSFTVAIKEAMNELQKFGGEETSKEPAMATQQRVQFKIEEMNRLIKDIPNGDNSIYALVVQNLADLNNAKTHIRKLEEQRSYVQNQ